MSFGKTEKPDHIYRVLIREHHLDTFSHVNNATYLQLFEEARWEWITGNGYGVEEVKRTGLGPVILEIQVRFLKEIKLRQEITIETRLVGYKAKIFKVAQQIVDTNLLYCTAEFSFALFDTNQRKLVSPTEQWKKAMGITT